MMATSRECKTRPLKTRTPLNESLFIHRTNPRDQNALLILVGTRLSAGLWAQCETLVRTVRVALPEQLPFGFDPIPEGIPGKAELLTLFGDQVSADGDVLLSHASGHSDLPSLGLGRLGRRQTYLGPGFCFGLRCCPSFQSSVGGLRFGPRVLFVFIYHGSFLVGHRSTSTEGLDPSGDAA